jgi:hypothetical protein
MAHKSSVADIMNDSAQSYKASIGGWRDGRRRASLLFRKVINKIPVDTPAIEPNSIPSSTALDALRLAKDLTVDICCGNDPISICAMQDTLFAFIDRIPKDHRLRKLEVTITVALPNDNNERSMTISDVWPTSRLKRDIIQRNKDLQPGDLSRMHMAAFLTDPLRKIRRISVGGKKELVQLKLPGRTGHVWKEIFDGVENLMRSDTKVKDYEVFRRYFADIRHLIKGIDVGIKNINRLQDTSPLVSFAPMSSESPAAPSSGPAAKKPREVVDLTDESYEVIDLTTDEPEVSVSLRDLQAITKALAMTRIRGGLTDLKAGHESLLEMADNILKAAAPLQESSRLLGVMQRLQRNKEYASSIFPDEVNISYYGYNESDKRLALYRSDRKGYVPQGGTQIKRRRKHTD